MNTNFQMMQLHGYSLNELETMIPWEREISTNLLMKHLEEEKQRLKAKKNRS